MGIENGALVSLAPCLQRSKIHTVTVSSPSAGRLDALFFTEMLGANKTPPFRTNPALDPTAFQIGNGKQIQRRRVVSLLEALKDGLRG